MISDYRRILSSGFAVDVTIRIGSTPLRLAGNLGKPVALFGNFLRKTCSFN
jgi:hypothetical protein